MAASIFLCHPRCLSCMESVTTAPHVLHVAIGSLIIHLAFVRTTGPFVSLEHPPALHAFTWQV